MVLLMLTRWKPMWNGRDHHVKWQWQAGFGQEHVGRMNVPNIEVIFADGQ
jgi:hypothetical protein